MPVAGGVFVRFSRKTYCCGVKFGRLLQKQSEHSALQILIFRQETIDE